MLQLMAEVLIHGMYGTQLTRNPLSPSTVESGVFGETKW